MKKAFDCIRLSPLSHICYRCKNTAGRVTAGYGRNAAYNYTPAQDVSPGTGTSQSVTEISNLNSVLEYFAHVIKVKGSKKKFRVTKRV